MKNKIRKGTVKTVSCLPTGQRTTAVTFIFGIFCRGLIAAMTVFGVALFFLDAITLVEEVIPFTDVLYPSFIFAFAVTFICINGYTFIGGAVLSAAAAATLYFTDENFIAKLYNGVIAIYNATVERLAAAGLAGVPKYLPMQINETSAAPNADAVMGAVLLTLVFSLLFTPAIVRRVKIVYLSILAAIVIVPVTVFNIVRDNWGFSVMISAFAAVTVMWRFECEYLKASKTKVICKTVSEAAAVISSTPLSEEVPSETKKEKKPKPKKKRGKDTDIEAALRLETPAERRKRIALERTAKRLDRQEKKRLAKEKKREEKKRQRLSGKEIFVNSQLGGALGVAAFALSFAVILFPTMIVKKGNSGLPYISDVMENARIYVTAFIRGDEVDLNDVASDHEDGTKSGPRTTKFDYPTYRDIQIAFVEVPYNTPVYLKTWIGTKYDFYNEQWTSATQPEIDEYRELFGEDFTPEQITEDFYSAIHPNFNVFPELSGYKDNYKYGFITERVNVRRSYKRGVLMYMPAHVMPSAGIKQYNSQSDFLFPHDAYFDGIWTSQFFIDGVGFSTLSNVTTMRYPLIGDVYTNSVRYYDISMSYIIDRGISPSDAENMSDDKKASLVAEYEKKLTKEEIQYNGDSLLYRYLYTMTEDEREALILAYELEDEYSEYVNDVYTELDKNAEASMESFSDMILKSAYYKGELDYLPSIGKGEVPQHYYHQTIMTLIEYMKNWCKYSLEAPEGIDLSDIGTEGHSKAIEAFLWGRVPGYCVHYASSLVLMLRYLGIPARYCEGYLVSDFYTEFHTNTDPLTRYKSKVLDSDAHAWVEVYYDGIGWVQYEATQPYLDGMYGTDLPEVDNNTEIDITDRDPTEITPPEADDDEIVVEEEFWDKFVRTVKIVLIVLLILCAIAFIVWIIAILKLTDKSVRSKKALIKRTADISMETKPKDAERLINGIFAVYEALDMLPEKGELSEQYAERLRELIGDASDKNVFEILKTVSKEEFGHGMSREELALLGVYYRDLITAVYEGISGFDRFRFRYLLRIV